MRFLIRLIECFFRWKVKYSSPEELQNSKVIIALSFGVGVNSPGKSNKALAGIVKQLYERFNLPIIVQKEIASCLAGPLRREGVRTIIRKPRKVSKKYLDSEEILQQAKSVCNCYADLGPEAILVAHPRHLWRVEQLAQKMKFLTRIADTSSVPYDPLSKQWFTRNFFFFLIREIPVRIFSLIRGWI